MTASQITQRPEGYQVEDHQPDQERLVIPHLFDGTRLSRLLRVKEHPVEIALDDLSAVISSTSSRRSQFRRKSRS